MMDCLPFGKQRSQLTQTEPLSTGRESYHIIRLPWTRFASELYQCGESITALASSLLSSTAIYEAFRHFISLSVLSRVAQKIVIHHKTLQTGLHIYLTVDIGHWYWFLFYLLTFVQRVYRFYHLGTKSIENHNFRFRLPKISERQ